MKLDAMDDRVAFFLDENPSDNYRNSVSDELRWMEESSSSISSTWSRKSDTCFHYGSHQAKESKKSLRVAVPKSRFRVEKAPHIVAKRNARERRRVEAVNNAFANLRKVVPIENTRGKRISKVKTLQKAIEYIAMLDSLLHQSNSVDDPNETNYYTNYEQIQFETYNHAEY